MIAIILTGVNTILIVLLGLFTKNFLPKYMEKKAENLATKEDIQEITKLAESIKSDIDIVKTKKIDWNKLQLQSLVEFYDDISILYQKCVSVRISDQDRKLTIQESLILKDIYERYAKAGHSQRKIELFCEIQELNEKCNSILTGLLNFVHHIECHIEALVDIETGNNERLCTALAKNLRQVSKWQSLSAICSSYRSGIFNFKGKNDKVGLIFKDEFKDLAKDIRNVYYSEGK